MQTSVHFTGPKSDRSGHMKRFTSYLFSSRNIDSTFLMTKSEMVGFSLTIASKLAGCDDAVVLGSVSSSFSSSDENEDEEDE